MQRDPTLKTEAPVQFTECVSTADGAANGVNDSRQMARRLQELIEQAQRQANPAGRALLHECVQSLMVFYGAGLARMLEHLRSGGAAGESILNEMLHDQAVAGLLFIHGLHPVPLETRLHGALEKVRPYMQSHGGNIELLEFNNDVARVRLQGTCKTCPSSAVTLELAVRRAVDEACPDLLGFEVIATDAETPGAELSASA